MCCCRIFLVLFIIVQFVALAAAVIGTPFDMFRPKDTDYTSDTYCLTLWGAKDKCYSTDFRISTSDYWSDCPERSNRFRAAQICAIITLAAFALSLIFAFVQCCCCLCCKWLCMVLNIVGVATGIVVFAMMLDSWNSTRGPELNLNCAPIKDYTVVQHGPMKIGAGLALFIVSVGLGFINIFFSLLPC